VLSVAKSDEPSLHDRWILDTGSSTHICNDRSLFVLNVIPILPFTGCLPTRRTVPLPSIFVVLSPVETSVAKSDEPSLHDRWILDTGSSTHICNDRSLFVDFTPDDMDFHWVSSY
jgi:hypothetical protein